ncbi:hypothetical protein V1514DRAFT_330343 [Lipomyces japonicus]|uniref:uncharacterized protein n=1 Tax=Lipomyces japonicus TaxID=56871 RepID=UPI0034CF1F17
MSTPSTADVGPHSYARELVQQPGPSEENAVVNLVPLSPTMLTSTKAQAAVIRPEAETSATVAVTANVKRESRLRATRTERVDYTEPADFEDADPRLPVMKTFITSKVSAGTREDTQPPPVKRRKSSNTSIVKQPQEVKYANTIAEDFQPSIKRSKSSNSVFTSATTATAKRKRNSIPATTNGDNLLVKNGSTSSKSASPTPRSSFKDGFRVRSSQSRATFLSNLVDLVDSNVVDGNLVLADGVIYKPNDYIYLVAEPPSEPYYIGRIMAFFERSDPSTSRIQRTNASNYVIENYQMRVNWLYRPKDIPTRSNDSRLLFATMHSDICPLPSLRGKCVVKHRAHIKDLIEYRKTPDQFWFDKLYDRYICHFYELIPTERVLNVPGAFGQALREQIKFAVVEIGRGNVLSTAACNCFRCGQWCPPDESVCCAECEKNYHMSCVRPPLLKKPTRGFAWACAICNREKERQMRESKGKLLPGSTDEIDAMDDDPELFSNHADNSVGDNANGEVDDEEQEEQDDDGFKPMPSPEFKVSDSKLTPEQKHELAMWPFRYLGIHANLNEALNNNDRIFPRAASRIGNKHQAVVPSWGGRPVVLIEREPAKPKKKAKSKSKKKLNVVDEPLADSEGVSENSDFKKPSLDDPWVQQKPVGYIERGGNDTATLCWRSPPPELNVDVETYMKSTQNFAKRLGMLPESSNFLDAALFSFMECGYNSDNALEKVTKFTRKSLKEPTLTATEVAKFENAVKKFGSELHPVKKTVGTVKSADIVRFYYLWKKTLAGKKIWGSFEGRKGKKDAGKSKSELDKNVKGPILLDDVADSADDSAYDMGKVKTQGQHFKCKFCHATKSRQWRRAPGFVAVKKNPETALCIRCAELWRRYAVAWENPADVLKKSHQRGSQGSKRKVEEEILKELEEGNRYEFQDDIDFESPAQETEVALTVPQLDNKKQISSSSGKSPLISNAVSTKSKKPVYEPISKIPEPARAEPAESTKSAQPAVPVSGDCGVCGDKDNVANLLTCSSCHMQVHKSCYGVRQARKKWLCEPCMNDRNPSESMTYECVLCPAHLHKEIPGAEKQPRDALKFTAASNWVHVICAVWTPEIKFTNAFKMHAVEGIGLIPKKRFLDTCSICKIQKGACIDCAACNATFHIGCALQANYKFGFDIQPIKSSRRDSFLTVKLGLETGMMTPMIWCPNHNLNKFTIHDIGEPAVLSDYSDGRNGSNTAGQATGATDATDGEAGRAGFASKSNETKLTESALNLYARTYKQADLSLTGTVRRAQQVAAASKLILDH